MNVTATNNSAVTETNWKRWLFWGGWLVSLWPAFVVGMSAHWKLTRNPAYVREFARIGWPATRLTLLAFLQLGSLILYLIPPTAVLGCVLLTGYLGGAVAAYTRIGQPYPILVPLSTSMIAWFGIWLRDARLRALLPIRFGLGKK
jgi:DoxX-like family